MTKAYHRNGSQTGESSGFNEAVPGKNGVVIVRDDRLRLTESLDAGLKQF
jgi:hypothetical protein